MKNTVVLLTIVSALSSQILPQILFLSIMAVEDGVGRLIPFMIFYVASMSGLLLWVYIIGRLGSKQTFLLALTVLVTGLICFLLPFGWAIELSAFLVGVGSIGVGSIMTTILSQLKELSGADESTEQQGSSLPLVLALVALLCAEPIVRRRRHPLPRQSRLAVAVREKAAAQENGDVDVGDRKVRACLHRRHRVHVGKPSSQSVGRGERLRGSLFIDARSARVRWMGAVPRPDADVRQRDPDAPSPTAGVRRRLVRWLDVNWRRIRQSSAIFVSSALILCVPSVLGRGHRLDFIEPCV